MPDNWGQVRSMGIGGIAGRRAGRSASAASSAAGAGSSTTASRPLRPEESESRHESVTSRQYVQAVLERYLSLPGTPGVTSRHDRRCAEMLFYRGVSLEVVTAALLLGSARRTFRAGNPLPPVRALHYFLPVIEDLQPADCDPDYVRHLERKLRPLVAAKRNASDGPPAGQTLRKADG